MTKKYLDKINNLSEIEYEVTQNSGTERPFANNYHDHKEDGIYVDIISGDPLFASVNKFDSGSGWPSFTKPIKESFIQLQDDSSQGLNRTEVASSCSHLGHVFKDGPKEYGGLRYCINSASLRFIAKNDLLTSGYGEYLSLFAKTSAKEEMAYLAGGCFWGLEHLLTKTEGIISTKVGYCGGDIINPTYQQVSSGKTGYAETVAVKYNPEKIGFREILKLFFTMHDPTTLNYQGNDEGSQYRSGIFYINESQKYASLDIIKLANQANIFPGKIITEVSEYKKFYEAEDHHQQYLIHNPNGYTCHFVRNEWKF